jgi:hypothetical protein
MDKETFSPAASVIAKDDDIVQFGHSAKDEVNTRCGYRRLEWEIQGKRYIQMGYNTCRECQSIPGN